MPHTKSSRFARELRQSVLLTPSLLLLVVFFIVPIILTVYYSFTNLALTGANAKNFHFVGLYNYQTIFSDPKMWQSIKATLIFLFGSLAGQSILGFSSHIS